MSRGIVAYGVYIPRGRVQRSGIAATLGGRAGNGARVVAGFDEDSTTMAVAAARMVPGAPSALYLATTTPAYADRTNATAVHAALALPDSVFAADVAGGARSAIAAWRAAQASGGLAVFADVRVGRPGSADESSGGDGAAAFLFGENPIAEVVAENSITAEFLDRWREPGSVAGSQWEERFGLEQYLPLIARCTGKLLADAGDDVDHVVLVSPNSGVLKAFGKKLRGRLSTSTSPIGHAGTTDLGIALAAVLDEAGAGETILAVSAADGCDGILLRTTDRIAEGRQPVSVAEQLASGVDVPYPTYLSWRGFLDREPPRRPEPDRAAAPPSARANAWKFAFTGTRCTACELVHLPPARVCKACGAVDQMAPAPTARSLGTVATYTVDRLAYSPAPPVVAAVVDFDSGGRATVEVADAPGDGLVVGARVEPTFRCLGVAGGVRNYFWKVRLV